MLKGLEKTIAYLTNEIMIVIKDENMVVAQHIGEVWILAKEVLKTQVVAQLVSCIEYF